MSDYALHPEAALDLIDIWEFIATDSPDAADRVIKEIREAILLLVTMPHLGHRRRDLTSRPLRFWRVYNYLIAYAPDDNPLLVIAILHGRRNPEIMQAILANRE